jgi:hypothetical protein
MKPPLEFHARLVEEAVWAAIQGHPDARVFHRERERLYGAAGTDDPERVFGPFHARWFRSLGLDAPVIRALDEESGALATARLVLAVPAGSREDQGAELFVTGTGEKTVVLKLRPEVLVVSDAALALLRRELTHVADMLDPAFGYEPALPPHPRGPAHDRLLQDRYRVLWGCSVDGRLVRSGRIPDEARARRLEEFRAALPGSRDRAEECFERIFGGLTRPRHPDLVAMAADPDSAFGLGGAFSTPPDRCPLCGFPTLDFEADPDRLPQEVLSAILSDFPAWRVESGVCRQCAELYRARPMSLAAARLLPGAGTGGARP